MEKSNENKTNEHFESRITNSINKKEEMKAEYIYYADNIGYKDIPDSNVDTDQFGFIAEKNKQSETTDNDKRKAIILRENARTEKWNEMIIDFDSFYKKNFSKLKSRTRKGIPDCIRGIAWVYFAKISEFFNNETNHGIYDKLKTQELDKETESVILRDINRTFPKNIMFKEKYGQGQRKLFTVLRAYSIYNKNTGYVQGMGFITALFLTYMDEEKTFWMIHSLMVNYEMQGYFEMNFPSLKKSFFVLLSLMKKHLNKLYKQFLKFEINPSMYASQWFLTLFSNCFKFDILVKFFDVFLLEGYKVIYRFALAILKINESVFLKAKSFEDALISFKKIYDNIDEELLFDTAFKFDFCRKDVEDSKIRYDKLNKEGNENDEILKLCMF